MDNFNLIVKLLKDYVSEDVEITRESTLKELQIDSLDLVEVVVSAEEEAMATVESEPVMRLKQRKRHRPSRLEEPEKVYYQVGNRNSLKRRQVPKKN